MTKHISMKKLTTWMGAYFFEQIASKGEIKDGAKPEDYAEWHILTGFLGYVWKHRND